MKKILLATTAMVAFAGAASAEVALSGYAEIGIVGGSEIETQFWNDIDVKFTLSGETDSGLTFGATIDLDELNGDSIDATGGGEASILSGENDSSVFVSGAFGKVTLGDTDGAFDWAMIEMSTLTTLADDHTTHVGFNANSGLDGIYDGQVARYEYAFGDFAVAVSAELDDTDTPASGDAAMGLGLAWSGDLGGTAVKAGFGYQSNGDFDVVGVSAMATMAQGFRAGATYAQYDGPLAGDDGDHMGVMLGYATGALSMEVNYGKFTPDVGADQDGFGLAVNYDLGGGAVVMAGFGSDVDAATAGDQNQFSVGLGLSF